MPHVFPEPGRLASHGHVADAQEVDAVWSARALEGEITISWTCAGHKVGGILDVSATVDAA